MNVLWPIGAGETLAAALDAVASQFTPGGATWRVLRVLEPIPPAAAMLWHDAGGNLGRAAELRAEGATAAAEVVAGMLRELGFEAEAAVRRGRTRAVLTAEARGWPADLLIFVAARRGTLARWRADVRSLLLVRGVSSSVEIVRYDVDPAESRRRYVPSIGAITHGLGK